ncbi:MAG: hypothetical protein AB7R89_25715 [Dehalococcoidia bacterium]
MAGTPRSVQAPHELPFIHNALIALPLFRAVIGPTGWVEEIYHDGEWPSLIGITPDLIKQASQWIRTERDGVTFVLTNGAVRYRFEGFDICCDYYVARLQEN